MVNLDSFFDQATEDASTALWAMVEWPGDRHDYTAGYVAIQLLAGYARCLHAKQELARLDLPPEYIAYREKLAGLLQRVEQQFTSFVRDHLSELEALFEDEGELSARLNQTAELLRKSHRIHLEGQLFDNQEWLGSELEDAEHDFLLLFSDLQRVAEVRLSPLQESSSYMAWLSRFQQLTDKFRDIFGYFGPSSDYLQKLRERECGAFWWWLVDPPHLAVVQEPELSTSWLEEVGKKLRATLPEVCPEPELVISYALGELSGDTYRTIQNHVHVCTSCLDLVVDTRWVVAAAEEVTESLESDALTHPVVAWLNRLIASTWESYDLLVQTVRGLAPRFQFPSKGGLQDAVSNLMAAEWDTAALPVAADTLEAMGVEAHTITGTQIEVQNRRILGIHPLNVIVTDQQFREGRLLLGGQVMPASPLPESTTLVCAWSTPERETLWPAADGIRFTPQTGEFLVRIDIGSRLKGVPRFLIVVSS